ncbi:transcriptional regulator, MarR family [Verrucomicrobium sp. GAS474]|uniref:MarR family winged helix-turn-helix transcriptional regulator n=1 Tax=Verrucomicrobium sp. GAS474 TaxID=1882831 RepID=UPI00087A75B0|nr:MarR family transcriptional regulator [Verrucomicrobium sp. GAS474]SDU14915.1 transcriptional regulator, MarR family [Verrucomicrobium sp. GAS474]
MTSNQPPSASYSATVVDLAKELAECITQLQRISLVDLSTQVSQGNISIPQYTLLSFLSQSSGITMSRLAELMEHTSPATTGLVDRLVAAGLVERFGNPTDRRQVLVKITDKGRELVEKIKSNIVTKVLGLSEDFTEDDMKTWVRIYRTILAHCSRVNQK